MKRRDFLKILGISPIAPSLLAAKEKPRLTLAMLQKCKEELERAEFYEEYLTTETRVFVNDKFIVSYNRELTDQEANAILDINADADVTFYAFGWRKY